MDKNLKRKKKGKIAFIFVAVILGVFLLVALLQYLWNTVMTDVFDLNVISYWQAFGLFVISKLLFGRGFGKPGGFRRRFQQHPDTLKDITDEDREKLREEWKRRFESRCC